MPRNAPNAINRVPFDDHRRVMNGIGNDGGLFGTLERICCVLKPKLECVRRNSEPCWISGNRTWKRDLVLTVCEKELRSSAWPIVSIDLASST